MTDRRSAVGRLEVTIPFLWHPDLTWNSERALADLLPRVRHNAANVGRSSLLKRLGGTGRTLGRRFSNAIVFENPVEIEQGRPQALLVHGSGPTVLLYR